MPVSVNRAFRRPAGPTAKTVPVMIRRMTQKIRMMFCITGPSSFPVTSEIDAPFSRSDIMPDR